MVASSDADNLALDLRGVAKVYRKRVHALRGVAMRVHRGEVFGLLGPNGAGKSTLVKIITTVVRPTRAEGAVLGRPVGHKPTLARIGYLPEHHRFPRYLTGRQVIEFYAALANVDRPTRQRRAAELLDAVGMTSWGDARIGTYSKGMMQRIGLAQALAADPDLLVLDEPTDGVDPAGRKEIRDVLLRLRGAGKTVFVNSHLLSELELMCDRVAILVQGQVVRQGTIDELTVATQHYEIDLTEPPPPGGGVLQALTAALESLPPDRRPRAMPGAGLCELRGATVHVATTDPLAIQPAIDALRSRGVVIRALRPVRQSLEDLYLEATVDAETGKALAPGARLEPRRAGARP